MKNITKKEKKELCRNILKNYSPGDIIEKEDEYFLLGIFSNYREWDIKKGVGVKYITVSKDTYGGMCFLLVRTDDTTTDISFIKSISYPNKLAEVKSACRKAVEPYIKAYANENIIYGITKCPISGEVLKKGDTHIDHYDMTFSDMFQIWIKKYDLDFLYSKINKTDDMNFCTKFTDKSIDDDFIEFHNANCKLRAVTKWVNMDLSKKRLI